MTPLTSTIPNGSLVVSLAIFSMLSTFDIILSSTFTICVSFMVTLVATKLLFHCLFKLSHAFLVANLITISKCNIPNMLGVC